MLHPIDAKSWSSLVDELKQQCWDQYPNYGTRDAPWLTYDDALTILFFIDKLLRKHGWKFSQFCTYANPETRGPKEKGDQAWYKGELELWKELGSRANLADMGKLKVERFPGTGSAQAEQLRRAQAQARCGKLQPPTPPGVVTGLPRLLFWFVGMYLADRMLED